MERFAQGQPRWDQNDSSYKTIEPAETLLMFSDDELAMMCRNYSAAEIKHIPGFKYWDCPTEHRMSQSHNICGHQQRAWEFYWALRTLQEGIGCSVGIGTGGIGAPAMLTTDKYNEGETPHAVRYPGGNQNSDMYLDADITPWPFKSSKIGCVIFNHSFEHLADQEAALKEAVRVTRSGGYVCILMPDMTYSKRGSIDPTHTIEWSADLFLEWLNSLEFKDQFSVLAHNTLLNDFSFDTVLRKA